MAFFAVVLALATKHSLQTLRYEFRLLNTTIGIIGIVKEMRDWLDMKEELMAIGEKQSQKELDAKT